MNLLLERIAFKDTYTIGRLYINGGYFCDTLEDAVRENKIYGESAIPTGTYTVQINMSPKFKRLLPLLLNVPNFTGIRIHAGNTDLDTEGCILVGENKIKGKIINSRKYEKALVDTLLKADSITIKVV